MHILGTPRSTTQASPMPSSTTSRVPGADRKIVVDVREVYGQTRYYPANALADSIAELTGRRTLSQRDFAILRECGFTIDARHKELP